MQQHIIQPSAIQLKRSIFLIVLSLYSVLTFSQTTTENYIKTTVYQEPVENQQEIDALGPDDKIESVTYFDGLGRPKQSIAQRAGGNREDLITPIEYDVLGRQPRDYLPYPELGNNGDYKVSPMTPLYAYYHGNYPNARHNYDINPYSEKRFEASPLNRVLEQGAPGKDWKIDPNTDTDHTIKFGYQTNTTDEVKYFEVDFLNNNTRLPQLKSTCGKYYAAGQLYKTVTKDENWQPAQTNLNDHTTEEFKDKLGRVILKRTYSNDQQHNTYYVYDDFGNLTYVLSPKASDALVAQSKISQGTITEQKYLYWTDLAPVDKELADEYQELLQDLDEDPELARQTLVNKYGGYGGIDISLNSDGEVTVAIDMTLTNPISFSSVTIHTFTLQDSNSLPDQLLGTFSGTGYSYDVSISNNSIVVSGSGSISQLTQTFTTAQAQQCVLDQEVVDNLCYQYTYDYRNRLVKKKIPQKGWEVIIYDKLDRPILTRDAKLKADGKWLFTKYDAFGRVAYTGFYSPPNSKTAEELADDTRTSSTAIPLYEERDTQSTINGTTVYYSNDAFPSTDLDLLTINYYDDYGSGTTLVPSSITLPTNVYGINPTQTNTKSLPTVAKVRVLDTNILSSTQQYWITSVTGYNKKGQAIYGASHNEYLGTTDISESKLDFTGKVEESTMAHTKNGVTITTKDFFTYDHMGRLKLQSQEINSQAREYLVRNTYDAIGQLINKGVGGTQDPNSSTYAESPLQNVSYDYNIRGWLTGINDGNLLIPSTNYTNLFTFKIRYNQPEKNASTPLYNGNISETYWRTANDTGLAQNKTRGYRYSYDALNRITKANSLGGITSNTKALSEKFTVKDISYDKNGNLFSLKRFGNLDGTNTYDLIDNLSYDYGKNSNQLLSVRDYGSVDGFKDGINTADDYSYDINGNMVGDANKQITNIDYNHLNLPTRVDIPVGAEGYIEYVYDATGVKLEKKVTQTNNPNPAITQYAGNYIYSQTPSSNGNLELQFFNHAEGYVQENGTGGYEYIYQYKDHLGNIRLSYSDSNNDDQVAVSEIIEESNYYPFGLKHKGYNNVINGTDHKFGYVGMEEQDELGLQWLDFGARNYDPALGRWMNIDPLAEDMRRHSPYNYAFNNPIFFMDPDGMAPDWERKLNNDGSITYTAQDGDSANSLHQQYGEQDGFSAEEAIDIVEAGVGRDNYTREDGMLMSNVEVDDTVTIFNEQENTESSNDTTVTETTNTENQDVEEKRSGLQTVGLILAEVNGTTAFYDDMQDAIDSGSGIGEAGIYAAWKEKISNGGDVGLGPIGGKTPRVRGARVRTTVKVSGKIKPVQTGARGGKYYINKNGNKTYLNRDGTKK